jgi:hypothetical protein
VHPKSTTRSGLLCFKDGLTSMSHSYLFRIFSTQLLSEVLFPIGRWSGSDVVGLAIALAPGVRQTLSGGCMALGQKRSP